MNKSQPEYEDGFTYWSRYKMESISANEFENRRIKRRSIVCLHQETSFIVCKYHSPDKKGKH